MPSGKKQNKNPNRTGTLPQDKAGDIVYYMADAAVKKYNADNDPNTPDDDYEWLGTLHQLNEELPVVITLPDQFRVGSWTFVVLREHDGVVEPLMTVNNGDGTLTVYTDRFSTYAIAAKAVTSGGQPGTPAPVAPGLPTSPNTGADSVLSAVLSVMSLVSLAGVVLLKKKQN